MNDITNEVSDTRSALLTTARRLFAARGYRGASVRAITGEAGANLGAVTYHFGSKERLYHAVLEDAFAPFRARLRAAASEGGPPLARVEAFVRAFFEYLFQHEELRGLVLQELAVPGPVPEPVLRTIKMNFGLLTELVNEGQAAGQIRSGDPALLALATATQPIALNIVRPVLEQAGAVSFASPEDRARLVDNAIRFVLSGLGAPIQGGRAL